MLLIWSEAAFAADMADDNFRAAMTAAPRFCTVGKKTVLSQLSSLITSGAGFPLIVAWAASGNWVDAG